jgi:glycosyltransferase involved in cell wall biosynthesis
MASQLDERHWPAVALFPWGDVIEDFLEPLDLRLADFVERMSGGWLFGYVAALRFARWRPFIVCASKDATAPERLVHAPSGVSIWVVRGTPSALPYSSRRSAAQWWRTPWRQFAGVLRREACDAIVVQEYEYARFDALALMAKALRLPLFATFQGGDQTLSRLEAWLRPWSLRQARGLVVASAQERERLAGAYPRLPPLASIPNPIDADEWQAIPRPAARQALGLAEGLHVVVSHCRIDIHRKGLDILLDAWRRFAAGRCDRRLVIVGSGQDNDAFGRLLGVSGRDDIDWHSRYTTDRSELRSWLSAADSYVTASRVEGMPVAPLEAMACGLPVVSSRAQGLPDIFADGEASGGILVPCEDSGAIAAGLERLAAAPALRARLGAAGRARVVGHFSLPSVGRSLADLLARSSP